MGAFQQPAGHHSANTNPIMDSFRLIAETRREVEAVTETAKAAVKEFYKNPQDLKAFIESHGTPVVFLPEVLIGGDLWSRLVLALLGFEPGFIPPPSSEKGRSRYRHLARLIGQNESNLSKGVFVLTRPIFTVGFLVHQLHHWFLCQSGLPGYNEKEQAEYRKFCQEGSRMTPQKAVSLNREEVISLQNAIHRELETLKFLRDVTEEIFRPARQGRGLFNGTTQA